MDLLLLNCSSLGDPPLFPYAFVQLDYLARRNGLRVVNADLTDKSEDAWLETLGRLLERDRPRAVGVHLRQLDTLLAPDYLSTSVGRRRKHFPVQSTARLVSTVRRVLDVPILVGGIGFSSIGASLLSHIGADYGCVGSPDDIFEKFEILANRGDVCDILNLVHASDGRLLQNDSANHPPPTEDEYTDTLLSQIERFYRERGVAKSSIELPIEISRGCPFKCYFCSEPRAKGAAVLRRNVQAILSDVERAQNYGIHRYWFVCSELNIGGSSFGLELSEALIKLQERSGVPINWSSYYLPTLSSSELRLLRRSGFRGGWNDVLSLDDRNLSKASVPYRARNILANLRATLDLEDEEKIRAPRRLDLFLGNLFVDIEAIRETLRLFDASALAKFYSAAAINSATRTYSDEAPHRSGKKLISVGASGHLKAPDYAFPTFQFSPALMDHFGSIDAIEAFFDWIASTFFSLSHHIEKDWLAFLRRVLPIERLARFAMEPIRGLDKASERWSAVANIVSRTTNPFGFAGLNYLLETCPEPLPDRNLAAKIIAREILEHHRFDVARIWEHMGIRTTPSLSVALSEYKVAQALYERYESQSDIDSDIGNCFQDIEPDVATLAVSYLIHDWNVRLLPEYRPFFIKSDRASQESFAKPG